MRQSTESILYELTVHDDGVTAVRKCHAPTLYRLYMIFKSLDEVRTFLIDYLEPRTPLDEIAQMIDDAAVGEWVEFK